MTNLIKVWDRKKVQGQIIIALKAEKYWLFSKKSERRKPFTRPRVVRGCINSLLSYKFSRFLLGLHKRKKEVYMSNVSHNTVDGYRRQETGV
jgi:hypothetical protein